VVRPTLPVTLALAGLAILTACRAPDGNALRRLACEQAAASLDMRSLSQMDALRKALGVAPEVDPIQACEALGAVMTPRPAGAAGTEAPAPREPEPGSAAERPSPPENGSEPDARSGSAEGEDSEPN
jgi:hypothetical protein